MRVGKVIVAVVISMLAVFAAQGAALADPDNPGMTHDGTEMTHD